METKRKKNSASYVFVALLLAMSGLLVLPARASDDPPPDYGKMEAELAQAYRAENYEKALGIAEKMHELEPDDEGTMYNIACLHCLLGHKDKAYQWLEDAIAAGYNDADHLAADNDFKTIRAEDRFRRIVKDLREGRQKKPDARPEKEKKEARKKDEAKKQEKNQEKQEKKEAKKTKDEKEKADKAKPPAKQTRFQLTEAERQQKFAELTRALIEASGEEDHYRALALALEARVLVDIGLTNYNVACMYSLLGQKEEAFRYLDRAIELGGFTNDMVRQIEDDKDFDKIRKDPRYAELLAKAGGRPQAGLPQTQGKPVDPEWQVTVPKEFDKSEKAPLIVALHSYNGSMDQSIEHWKAAAEEMGAILLTPQGTFQLENGHYHWGRDLNVIEENIMDAIDEVMDEYTVDKKKMVVVGFSQGGWVTWELAFRNPDVFCGAIPVGGRFPPNWEDNAEEDLVKNLRIFAMVGADDDEDLVNSNKEAPKVLKAAGIKIQVKVYDGVGHDFPKKATEEQVKALKFVWGN